jgi:hypothetical protein
MTFNTLLLGVVAEAVTLRLTLAAAAVVALGH